MDGTKVVSSKTPLSVKRSVIFHRNVEYKPSPLNDVPVGPNVLTEVIAEPVPSEIGLNGVLI